MVTFSNCLQISQFEWATCFLLGTCWIQGACFPYLSSSFLFFSFLPFLFPFWCIFFLSFLSSFLHSFCSISILYQGRDLTANGQGLQKLKVYYFKRKEKYYFTSIRDANSWNLMPWNGWVSVYQKYSWCSSIAMIKDLVICNELSLRWCCIIVFSSKTVSQIASFKTMHDISQIFGKSNVKLSRNKPIHLWSVDFDKDAKSIQWGRNKVFNIWC